MAKRTLNMPKVNHVLISGYIGKEPDIRSYGDNKEMMLFSIANTIGFGDKEKTNWFNVVVFKVNAFLKKHLHKGVPVIIEGVVNIDDYTNKAGEKRNSVKITAMNIHLLSYGDDGMSDYEGPEPPPPDDEDTPF